MELIQFFNSKVYYIKTLNYLQELHSTAHVLYARFYQSGGRRRAREHRTRATLAAAEAIASQLHLAPSLAQCSHEERAQFRSLPMAAAVRARVSHKETLAMLDMPAWQRRLNRLTSNN